MATLWTDVILTQEGPPERDTSPQGSMQRGFALLARGRFSEYEHGIEQGEGWPSLDADEQPADPDRELVVALLQQIVHGRLRDAADRYRALAGEEHPPDLRAVAVTLGSLALADDDRHGEALGLLEDLAASLEADGTGPADQRGPSLVAGRALIALHRGWRHAEREEWEQAIAITPLARDIRGSRRGIAALRYVAAHNLWWYQQALDPGVAGPPRRPVPRALQHRVDLVASGLEWRLDDELRRVFSVRAVSERRFGFADPAEHDLWAGAFYGECLAWAARIPALRRLLGSHRLLRWARRDEVVAGEPAPGVEDFRLLLEGRDVDGLERAARWYRDRGPLDSLAEFTARLVVRDWLRSYEHGILAVWRVAGGLLPVAPADKAVARLTALLDEAQRNPRPTFFLDYEVMRALPAVLAAASRDGHRRVLGLLLELLAGSPPERVMRPIGGVLRAVRWEEATEEQLAAARERARRNLGRGGNPDVVVSGLLLAMADRDRDWVTRTLDEFLRSGDHTAALDALALDTGVDLSGQALDDLIDRAVQRVARVRQRAAEGRWSVGEINNPFLLVVALLRRPHSEAWSALFDCLGDPLVAAPDKVAVLDLISYRIGELPDEVVEAARATASRGIDAQPVWPVAAADLPTAVLRLQLAVGTVDAVEARRRLLALATDERRDSRVEAAWTIPLAWDSLPALAPVLADVLARDPDHEVRAAAGAMLGRLPLSAEDVLDWVTDEWRRLLQEPGVLVPLAVLRSVAGTASPPPALLDLVAELAVGARSAHVRRAAGDVLGPPGADPDGDSARRL